MTDASPTASSATSTRSTARRCGVPECVKTAKPGGYCIAHGGGKKCSVSHCTTSVVSRGFCVAHGGGKRCQHTGCTKSAQTGGCCWVHGGGKKCGIDGCAKRAQSGGACIAHGGGKRCRLQHCNKVVQFDGLCVSHGGFRKCIASDCDNKALANSYCHAHGGHSQCLVNNCSRKAVKGGLCSDHKSQAAAAGIAAITPVMSRARTHNNALRRSIEPQRKNKQQQQQQTSSSDAPGSTSSAAVATPTDMHSHATRSGCLSQPQPLQIASVSSRSNRLQSPPPAWPNEQLCASNALPPSFAFAKGRPSLRAVESLLHTSTRLPMAYSLHAEQIQPLASSRCCSNRSTGATASPILPALRMNSPLPSLGRRSCSTATTPMRSSCCNHAAPCVEHPQQPIERFASLANIAKLSRPVTPPLALTPLVVERATVPGTTTTNWQVQLCTADACERGAATDSLCACTTHTNKHCVSSPSVCNNSRCENESNSKRSVET